MMKSTTYSPDELYFVLESFKPALKSIDLRCVAVTTPSEDYWQNLVTSIFFSNKTVDEVKNGQKTIPQVHNNYFGLFYDAVPFNDWYDVLGKIMKGILKIPIAPFGTNRIQFRKSDLSQLKVSSSKEWINGSYRCILRAVDSGSGEERKELWSIVDRQGVLSKQFNFDSIPQLIEHHLKIRYNQNDQKDIGIAIYPPATIENLQFRNNNLEVILEKTSELKGLQLNLRTEHGARVAWRRTCKIAFEKTEFRNNPEVIDIRELSPLDLLFVQLIHRDSGLTLDEVFRRVPIKNVSEPFLKTFDTFCSLDKLKSMLFEPKKYGKRPEKIFENAVTWLLSLAGFEAIHLGVSITKLDRKQEKFDVLYAKGGIPIGCADTIAYEESEWLLLIDCTIGSIDEAKVQELAETKKYFREKLKGYEKLPISAILFSPKEYRKSSPSLDVLIADKSIIERIFEAVVKGKREDARFILHYAGS